MEIREERIEKTIYETKKTYVANDGTEFENLEECEKYEQTAICAINGMFNKLPSQKTEYVGELDMFCRFGCEDTMYAVKIENLDALETVNKWIKATDETAMVLGIETIGTIQLIDYCWGDLYVQGTPEELKRDYCKEVDRLVNKLIEKDGESE